MDSFQQLFIVGAVLVTFAAALWTLQRRGFLHVRGVTSVRSERRLQVIERLQLTPTHSVCLIRVENRTLLIGTAPSNCQVLQQGEL